MEGNLYEFPHEPARNDRPIKWWQFFLWALAGFVAGTAVAKPLILAIGNWNQIMGGMIYGGIPLATAGLIYGMRRARP